MKKVLQNIFKSMIVLTLAVLFAVPSFSCEWAGQTALAESEQESVKYELLSPSYNANADQTYDKYNITTEHTSSFTPFDFENGQRMSGMSFTFPADDRYQIVGEYINVDRIDQLSVSNDYSLVLWIYFDNVELHDMSITLEFEDGGSIFWNFTAQDLYALIRKYSGVQISETPYGWNKFELPFYLAKTEGNIIEGSVYDSITKFKVDFQSDLLDTDTVAKLRFYDIYVAESSSNEYINVEKQDYRFYSFNFFEEEIVESLCVGDSLYIPTFSKAVNYAWSGDVSLTDTRITTVTWKVVLKTPNENQEYLYPSFGDKIDFDEEGTYQLSYQCYDTSVSSSSPIISGSQTIEVYKLSGVYFEKSSLNVEVGKTYVLNVYSSSKLYDVSEFSFVSSSEFLEVEYKGAGVFEITATKEGSFSVDVSVEGSRPASPTLKQYTSTLSVTASVKDNDNNKVLKIVLWCVAGVFVVILIVLGIKSLVKSNKYDVK